MFIESCKFCGEVFTSSASKFTHPSNCLSVTQDDKSIDSPKETNQKVLKNTKKKRIFCHFCGKHDQVTNHNRIEHLRKCLRFRNVVDLKQKKCLKCKHVFGRVESYSKHFQDCHSEILLTDQGTEIKRSKKKLRNEQSISKVVKQSLCYFCGKNHHVFNRTEHLRKCSPFHLSMI